MAKSLSTTGIADSSQLFAAHVTQSIDALKGTEAYNLNPSGTFAHTGSFSTSGSANITGSLNVSGSVYITGSINISALTGSVIFSQAWISSSNFASDDNAATGGVPIGGVYHDDGELHVRLYVIP